MGKICSQFCNFRINCSAIYPPAYNLNGDVKKFYLNSYKTFVDAEDLLERAWYFNCTCLLWFENVNHILAYITGATYSDDVVNFYSDTKFFEKEKSPIV